MPDVTISTPEAIAMLVAVLGSLWRINQWFAKKYLADLDKRDEELRKTVTGNIIDTRDGLHELRNSVQEIRLDLATNYARKSDLNEVQKQLANISTQQAEMLALQKEQGRRLDQFFEQLTKTR